MPTKPEDKIQVHKKRVRRGLHIPMVIDGGKVKKLKFFVLLRILRISGGETQKMTELKRMKDFYHRCLRQDRSKALRRKGGDSSNVSDTIVKKRP